MVIIILKHKVHFLYYCITMKPLLWIHPVSWTGVSTHDWYSNEYEVCSATRRLVSTWLWVVFLCCPIMCLRFEFRVMISVTISAYKRCSVRIYLQFFVGGRMSYLRFFMFICVYCCLTHFVLCYFVLFFFVLCTLCGQFLWIALFDWPLSIL